MAPHAERIEVKILGKIIGSAECCDMMDNNNILFYDFEPNKEFLQEVIGGDVSSRILMAYKIDLEVSYNEGLFIFYDADLYGEEIAQYRIKFTAKLDGRT